MVPVLSILNVLVSILQGYTNVENLTSSADKVNYVYGQLCSQFPDERLELGEGKEVIDWCIQNNLHVVKEPKTRFNPCGCGLSF